MNAKWILVAITSVLIFSMTGMLVNVQGYNDPGGREEFSSQDVLAQAPVNGPWYVASGGNDGNTCLAPASPCATINAAIGKASPGDTIYVATGTYTSTTGSEVALLDKDITLSGGWDMDFTAQSGSSTIDGGGVRRGVEVASNKTRIEYFVIQNGFHDNQGGGIHNTGSLTVTNSLVRSNISQWMGGGIFNTGILNLNNTSVTGNSAGNAGGSGGGGGGGVENYGGELTLNNSVINGNLIVGGFDGSAIDIASGTVTLNNSTISGNRGSSAAIYSFVGNLNLNSSTIANNQGNSFINYAGTVKMQNTIIASNSGEDCHDDHDVNSPVYSLGFNLIQNNHGCTMLPSDISGVDPQIQQLNSNNSTTATQALLPGSPAINAGNPAGCEDSLGSPLDTDQRGAPRFGRCDIGAYELQPLGFSSKTADHKTIFPDQPLTYTLEITNGGAISLTHVLLTDTLPGSLIYIENSLTATSGNVSYNTGQIRWNGPVDAGSNVKITYGATVEQSAPLGTVISNTAILTGDGELFTRTATVRVDYNHIYLPIMMKPRPGIEGLVNLNGAPIPDVPLELRFYDGANWSTRATTSTAPDGHYTFLNQPGLEPGQKYYVLYRNDAGTPGRLWVWGTPDITSYTTGSPVSMEPFDIADIAMVYPWDSATVSLPFTFRWLNRPATPSDTYEFDLYDPNDLDPLFYTDPPLGYVGEYTLMGLPPGFKKGVPYVWEVWAYSPDGGFGISYNAYWVTFTSAGLNAVPLERIPHSRSVPEREAHPPIR